MQPLFNFKLFSSIDIIFEEKVNSLCIAWATVWVFRHLGIRSFNKKKTNASNAWRILSNSMLLCAFFFSSRTLKPRTVFVVVYTLANIMGNGHVAWVHEVLRDTLSNQNTNQRTLCLFTCAFIGRAMAHSNKTLLVSASNWTFWQLCVCQ